ncbi:MAG: trigger factor [Candidatus Margulisbacteria bacterium]|nr:trigger factor [Candidatus Margulisiibacteriota bacterium]
MKILTQKREGNKVFLEIEEDYSRFQKSYDNALAAAGKEIRIAGFRPGKAPRKILEGALNLEAVEQRAAQDLIAEEYSEIIETSKIDPVDYPSVEITQQAKDKPFLFKLAVDVYPEVKLGKYKGIKLEKKAADVPEAEVFETLGRLQDRFSTVNAEGKKELLPLDDEFAKKVSRFGTLAELKEEVNRAMLEEKKAEADADLRNQAIAAAGADAKVEVPPAMVDREIDIMQDELRTSLAQSGLTLEDYLRGAQKEEKALRDDLKKSAEIRVRGKIVLKAVAAAEKIEVTPEEMQAEIKAMAQSFGQDHTEAEKRLNQDSRKYIEEYLIRKKALDFLIEHASVKIKEEKKS